MAYTAVIPVRAGSTRVKDKNIRPFAGSSLLEVKIEQLKRISYIDQIVVSSDSEQMLELATCKEVMAIRRPIEYCDEKSKSFNEVVRYIAQEQVSTEDMMWVPCVCPLLEDNSIIKAMEIYECIKRGEISNDSLVSAKLLQEYVFDEHGPINFSVEHHVPSQRLPRWHTIQNGFFIAPRIKMIEWGFVYGRNPFLYEIDDFQLLDIDNQEQFEIAELLYLRRNGKQD